MASIVERPKKSGEITYQVKWREGGAWQSENFGDPDQADQFKRLVEAHGGTWPHGWTKGLGFVEPETHPDDHLFADYAHRYVDGLNTVDDRTKHDYKRDIENHFVGVRYTDPAGIEHRLGGLVHLGPDGTAHPATVCNLTQADVNHWVTRQRTAVTAPDDPERVLRAKASPKSVANRHGLLYCIMQAAVEAEPQLRESNPCKKTGLPRQDDGTEEEMVFLEHDEYARISLELRALDPNAADLADFLVGTGMRWGEATAIQSRDINWTTGKVSVQRAWKRQDDNTFEIGPPKTRKARRLVKLNEDQLAMLRRHVTGRGPEDYVFRGGMGKAWRHSNFYHRKWERALKEAIKKGLTKRPRIHDLRHTHVAWLIEQNISPAAIQARVGHESITTTIDRYGHLLSNLDDEISAAVANAMRVAAPRDGLRPVRSA
ncbi:tyrosine-type recombinase/integrase [Streptomyces longhuiensis]|uniref:tyrosine-type recombinase/integrase n=1 Tax=Streptomyces longhuiensis TaxID=2880933 RepID=UPI001D0AC885|nr:site-specific integrase [Streptomyces longhuiensis]UDM00023.1 site-specific integrase [Streptomyces longhuiensis]